MSVDYRQLVKRAILDEEGFLRATFSGRRRGQQVPWVRVVLRPVLVRGRRRIQFSYFEHDKDITRNYAGDVAQEKLDQLLALAFKNIHVQTAAGSIQVKITKKGEAFVHRSKAPAKSIAPDLAHDRQKKLPLPADSPDPFLQAIGVMTAAGKVRASMRGKFRQINQFLSLIRQTDELEKLEKSPLHVVDCGCGSAQLTFAFYHFLNHILGLPAHLTGIDVKVDLLQKHVKTCRELGWPDLTFQATRIADFGPATPPDIVLALHACDTATDEALAQGIRWQSKLILSVPCCHHHLQQQLNQGHIPSSFRPVMRHGILRERLGDILTDAFRAQILRIMGYRTDVVEFISLEHTARNLMIRAVRSVEPGNPDFRRDYEELKTLWGVTPYLEGLLGEAFAW